MEAHALSVGVHVGMQLGSALTCWNALECGLGFVFFQCKQQNRLVHDVVPSDVMMQGLGDLGINGLGISIGATLQPKPRRSQSTTLPFIMVHLFYVPHGCYGC